MKKSIIAAGAASAVLAAMPVLGVFADGETTKNSVTDVLSVKLNDSCSLSATAGTNGVVTPATANTISALQNYTATYYGTTADALSNGQYKDYTATAIKVICNNQNGWMVNAVGASDTNVTGNAVSMNPTSATSTPIASMVDGTTNTNTPSGASSWWAMKLSVADPSTTDYDTTIKTEYASWHSIPATADKVAYGPITDSSVDSSTGVISGTGSTFTTNYRVYIGSAQQADTYTGKVTYTLLHPNDTSTDND